MKALRNRCIQCMHVDARAKTTASVGTRSHAALYYQTVHTAYHVGQVNPEHRLTLRVIERHIIHRHVDARLVGSADMKISVTDSQTIVTGGHHRRRHVQQIRQVLPRVVAVQLLVSHLLFAHRRLHDGSAHHDLLDLKITRGQGVHLLLRTRQRRYYERARARKNQPCMVDKKR